MPPFRLDGFPPSLRFFSTFDIAASVSQPPLCQNIKILRNCHYSCLGNISSLLGIFLSALRSEPVKEPGGTYRQLSGWVRHRNRQLLDNFGFLFFHGSFARTPLDIWLRINHGRPARSRPVGPSIETMDLLSRRV
jgi:hypothetical protein